MPTKTNGCHFLKISLLCPTRQSIAKIHGWQILKQGRLCLKRLSHTHFKENRGLPTINKATSRLAHNKSSRRKFLKRGILVLSHHLSRLPDYPETYCQIYCLLGVCLMKVGITFLLQTIKFLQKLFIIFPINI